MDQDAARSRRDLRAYRLIFSTGAAVGVAASILTWGRGINDVSVIFLAMAVLLLPLYLLLRRDALRRDMLSADVDDNRESETAPSSRQGGTDDELGQIVIRRPEGFWQDALRRYKIVVDGQEVGSLKRGEVLRHSVAAGHHDVIAKIDWSGSPAAQVDVPSGGTVTLRVGPGSPLGLFTSEKWLTLTVDGRR